MVEPTEEDIVKIHNIVETRFNITRGIIDKSLLKSITERPNTRLFTNFKPYDTIFLKAASLMEGIIRWHPFADGNKRTALLTVIAYLHANGYSMAIPLSAVRYTVTIAKNQNIDEESTRKLIEDIAGWIEKLSIKSGRWSFPKTFKYFLMPLLGLAFVSVFGFTKYAEKKIRYWMAFDIYPEYEKEASDILRFLIDSMGLSFSKK